VEDLEVAEEVLVEEEVDVEEILDHKILELLYV
jgi:hypothetical protein